jgi:hypothetical protein
MYEKMSTQPERIQLLNETGTVRIMAPTVIIPVMLIKI